MTYGNIKSHYKGCNFSLEDILLEKAQAWDQIEPPAFLGLKYSN